MDQAAFNQGLLEFIKASPTPFHAVTTMAENLVAAGFTQLHLGDNWQLQPGAAYFITRNDSSLIAFRTGSEDLVHSGVKIAGAHTDSPCLKVKPQPEIRRQGYGQLGVEVYGGALLHPWFDRDLSIAGRVNFTSQSGVLQNTLVNFKRPIAVIPSLAIHLDREANQNHSVNAQNHLPPILLQISSEEGHDFRKLLKDTLLNDGHDASEILDFELCLYDVQPPALVGMNEEFIASARLDNLLSCYTGLQALVESTSSRATMLVCNDHEEVGSSSAAGAHGPFLLSVLERFCEQLGEEHQLRQESFRRMLSRSMLVSMDNAHGVHPNFSDKHDAQHGPMLNKGPVIKINANQRYATNSGTSSAFRKLAMQVNEPVQSFVVRSDLGCGSTIGPIVATELGVDTVDVGVPTFAMHSIRELAGARDAFGLMKIMQAFYQS